MKRSIVVSSVFLALTVLLVGQGLAAEKGSGMNEMEARCAKYYKDDKGRNKCLREERRAALDIFDLIEELKDAGKPMKLATTSKEYGNAMVQKGKCFSACATLFELHKDRMACYTAGVKKYQEWINARMAGKDPFAK